MPHYVERSKEISCPGCGEPLNFDPDQSILVNAESEQLVEVKGLFMLRSACNNPFCGWSNVKGWLR